MPVLRDLLLLPQLPPLWNNVISALIMVIWYRCTIEFAGWLRTKFGQGVHVRQLLHMTLSFMVVFWPLFDTSDWSWRLNTLLPATMIARMIVKARTNDPDDLDVQNFTRSSSPSELLYGPLQLCCLMVYMGLYQFMTPESALLAAAVGVGDGLAPIIGGNFGRHVYHMPLSNQKTMEGSLVGVFLGTVAGQYLYLYLMGIPVLPLRMILAYAFIASLVEGSSPGNFDNVVCPFVIHFSMDKVTEWVPP